jgi:hypothetical protein
VSEYLIKAFEGRKLPGTLKPASVSKFSESFCALTRAIKPTLSVHEALEAITDELTRTDPIPVSLSLYQLFLGMLCQSGRATMVTNIPCHVTSELAALFPGTSSLQPVFDYDS